MSVQSQTNSAPVWEFLASRLPVDWLPAQQLPVDASEPAEDPMKSRPMIIPPPLIAQIARVLHRAGGHVLLTGDKGVGKTAFIRELPRLAAQAGLATLANRRFVWVDCANVGAEDSRACFETIVEAVDREPDIVLCLDGIQALVKRPNGGNNKPLLRALAARPRLRIIGILSRWEFIEQFANDADLLELFTRIELEQPDDIQTLEIARGCAQELEQEFRLRIPEGIVQRAVALSSSYMFNACQPAKAVRVLRRSCEDVDFARKEWNTDASELANRDIDDVIAELTGIPAETLSGDGADADFQRVLETGVVGQEDAVRQVAAELRLIKGGLTDPSKPATVLLFAGMTGVGKTELAKRVAELYSSSRRLQTYTMGNFTEPHSVSGIIGVPPGYVGHEQGGRLVNELNADPYSVFLLDEAEKAHPNVWKPFLNLFDEGWVVDQRGTKAYADRAVFILTTNAGDSAISQMTATGAAPEAIVENVKNHLSRIRQERTSQPVFPPQFLSRIRRIIVFRPLDELAMIGIARRQIEQMRNTWLKKRERDLVIPEDLIEAVGRRAHELNSKAGGKEGGRIVRRLIADFLELPVQEQATERREAYLACREIHLEITEISENRLPSLGVRFLEGIQCEELTEAVHSH